MRAAYLLSLMFLIGGVLAVLGYPAIYVAGRPILGLSGLLVALVLAALPPLVVLGFRKMRSKRHAG
jgi:hypothetical protein